MHTARKRRLAKLATLLSAIASSVAGAGTDDGWQSRVTRAIGEGEYHLSLHEATGGFTAPNRAHDFRSRWSSDGSFALESRTDAKAWSFSYRLLGFARGDAHSLPEVRHEHVSDGRIEWQRDGIREWYVNDARGVEQGFVLESRPGGDPRQPVVIEGSIDGLLAFPTDDGESVLFRTPQGRDAVRISDLSVVDASGTVVPACLEVGVGVIAIVVDDREARYPLTIASLMTTPGWTAESDQPGAQFGLSVATAGDVNGDGYADVIVGAEQYDNGEANEGRAFVYLGSVAGVASTAAWTAESDQATALFGRVATAGDINGDGYSDVIVGAYRYDNGQNDEGRMFLYLGSISGLATAPAWTAESDQADAWLGYAVATAGDVNGDGFDDVIAGAYLFDNGQRDEGRAYVYLGSISGLATAPSWTGESDQLNAAYGIAVGTAGDVDGDGLADVIVGARQFNAGMVGEGRALVYLGTPTGVAPSPVWSADGGQVDASFGGAVAGAGDVNGDGFSDVIVGAYFYDNGESDEGRAFLYLGSISGLATAPSWTAESDQMSASFAQSVATAGDVNGDGYADVVVGDALYDNGERDEGRASIFLGSATGLAATPAWTVESEQADAQMGIAVATAGDVNGDGFSDVIVGAWWYDNGETDEGRAYVYLGFAAALGTIADWTAESNQVDAYLGCSVATAGDVNGDGYSDVVVGAWRYDSGDVAEGRAFLFLGSASGLAITPAWTADGNQFGAWFGQYVGTAGDVDGDGYSDVLITAPGFDDGETDEGRVFVFQGSTGGLASSPTWIADGDQINAYSGQPASTAGDVNGDGFSDIIVGASRYDNGEIDEGRAAVFQGSASGLTTTPSWTAEGNQADAWLGGGVATAGDVNGDGFSDIIIGANGFDNGEAQEGRALVFLGSASGLGASPAWTLEADQADAGLGLAVATAGDVDGDGFSDVIVGAPGYDNPEVNEGRVFMFRGSPAGLSTIADWTVEGDRPTAACGFSIATAGDVNADGYADVVVGAPGYDNFQVNEGRALLYLGSPSGLPTTAAWTTESNVDGAVFSNSVATAGDVNGDGYSDLLVGAPGYDNGEAREGLSFLFYGNAGDGLDRIPRQARADGSAPIDLLGGTLSTDGFRLRANGRSPFGRDQVRLEWEVKTVATPFDGADIRTSSWFDTGAPGASGSVVPLDELHTPLAGPGPFHWRLRLRSRSPFPWQSHWMSLPYNAITETDLRTENNLARCDLAYADLTFSPLTPARVAPWVYTQSCPAGDVLPTLLVPSIVSGSDVDTLGGSPGTLRFYQLSCGCADGIKLIKRAGSVRLETF